MTKPENVAPEHFIRQIIKQDLASGKHQGRVATRFPPEPNGYLHIGHAKSICLNFGLAQEFSGTCNLRFDDTNPEKENQEYIDSIERDVRWLGFSWSGDVRHASDYFLQLYEYAVELIRQGKAYVDHLNAEQMREYRGTLTEAGRNSPFRDRGVEENLALFEQMRAGAFDDGECVLRAKIDMSSPNINMRDPVIYRIRKVDHHQTGNEWQIYPMYDYTHCISDALEEITHSICTLEFEDHRPLYDWVLDQLPVPCHPQQIEFSRLNLNYTVTSKRKLKQLVDEGHVNGWDDPRMPTIAGMRRRGYTPSALRQFCEMIGVTKSPGVVDVGMLEFAIRDDLDRNAPRAMCVLRPLRVVLENYPESSSEELWLSAHPKDESLGKRRLVFERELFIDQSDFMENPPSDFKRLTVGGEVRLRGGYIIKCERVIKDGQGVPIELRCSYDPETLGKNPVGRKVKGVIHWASANHSLKVQVRLYNRLFNHTSPDSGEDGKHFLEHINPESLVVLEGCVAEPGLVQASDALAYQFEREGYFVLDAKDSSSDALVFNRTVELRDSWAKVQK
ncbi:Glutaminyl-tRNA synthetase [gamma proteobacterium HdN1]|nr:Glutaminyl-tRNA synthetase [gamma proteobacterium HdN1]